MRKRWSDVRAAKRASFPAIYVLIVGIALIAAAVWGAFSMLMNLD